MNKGTRTVNLSNRDFDYIRSLLEKDAEEIAIDISFFAELNLNPKEFIDERISLCNEFGLDFWSCVSDNCPDYQSKRLKALYKGEDLKKFISNYEIPSENELAKNFLRMIIRKRNVINKEL